MSAASPIRAISADEFPAFYAVLEHAFNSSRQTDAELQHELVTFELDRSLAAFDGPDIVGTAGAFTFRMTVPGDALAVAGVTAVSVLPSHPPRRILSSLMNPQLAAIRHPRAAVPGVFASEAATLAPDGDAH